MLGDVCFSLVLVAQGCMFLLGIKCLWMCVPPSYYILRYVFLLGAAQTICIGRDCFSKIQLQRLK